ncbi:hypothetical protein PR002_g15615 [Phytophthora rubi]|uniref:Uncharacterized protein n=1 Tax=Phytophthora rubi TaxID=129364 RepID=A0A6A3KQF7_9STRA|nr:hypothetical protein PR002_g15615 [Phytophthora rubi]
MAETYSRFLKTKNAANVVKTLRPLVMGHALFLSAGRKLRPDVPAHVAHLNFCRADQKLVSFNADGGAAACAVFRVLMQCCS